MSEEFLFQIDWPNGKGCTPCTLEYLELHEKVQEMMQDERRHGELYEAYHQAQHDLDSMHASGKHVGVPIKY